MVSGHVQMMRSAPSFKPEQDWEQYVVLNCSLWGRESELHFCSSLNSSLRGSWVGLIPQRWVTFMLYIIHIFNRNALGFGPVPPSMKSPWKTRCGSAGKDQTLLMWRQEGEHSWQSCCLFQVRNLVNKALNNCTSEKGLRWKYQELHQKRKFICIWRNTSSFTKTKIWAAWHIVWSSVRRDYLFHIAIMTSILMD